MRTNATAPCALALILSALATPSSAQAPKNTVDWGAASSGSGSVTRVLVGDFTEDLEPDVVLLDQRTPILVYAPYFFDAGSAVGSTLSDVADLVALRGASQAGQDLLLASVPSGLVVVSYDAVTGAFRSPVQVAGSAWASATPLLAARPRAGFRPVFGVQGERTVLSLYESGGVFYPGPGFATLDDVLELVALDWNADGAQELAIRTRSGVEVRSLDGTLLRLLPGGPEGALAVVVDGLGRDHLVWAQRALGETTYVLAVLDASTWAAPPVQLDLRVPEVPGAANSPLVDLEITGLAAGPLEGGGSDIVLCHGSSRSVYVLGDADSGAGLDYSLDVMARIPLAEDSFAVPSRPVAPAAVANLDNAGGGDLLLVSNDDLEVRVLSRISYPAPKTAVHLSSGSAQGGTQNAETAVGLRGASYDTAGPSPTDFYPDFSFPEATSMTHLQLIVWQQDEGVGTPVQALSNTLYPLGQCSGGPLHAALSSLPSALGSGPPRPYQFLQYRLVRMVGQQIVEARESRVGALVQEVVPGEFEGVPLSSPYLEQAYGAECPSPLARGAFDCYGGPDGTEILGIVYADSAPPLPPSTQTPNPGVAILAYLSTLNH